MTYEDVLTVAVVNFKLAEGNKESNLRRMKGFAEAASKRGADLILFPEMCLMGCDYFMSADIPQESKRALAELFDGPSAQAMAEISKKYGNYIVYGAAQSVEESDKLYNSAIVTGPEGVIGAYRKIHPFADENIWCEKGETPFMFETPWGPVGIGICYDTYQFPELLRYYVSKGCRLYLNPTALTEEISLPNSRAAFKSYYKTMEYGVLCNTIFVANANLTGYGIKSYFGGGSCVVGPKVSPFYETDIFCYGGDYDNTQESIDFATIDLSLATRNLCQINKLTGEPDYRPEIYKKFE